VELAALGARPVNDKRTITVNGSRYEMEVPVRITLANFIRYELGLTGILAASTACVVHALS
jgi:aerobic-type carbon monoxide dehydrogenase small subunit (CoxS/CutS family)